MERVEEPAIQSETLIVKVVVPEQIAEEFVVKTADSEPILEQSEVIAEENTTVCVNLVPETANTKKWPKTPGLSQLWCPCPGS